MSSQCGCSNSESVMTLHSQRILLWKGYPKNRMAHDDRGNQHQNSRVLPYRQNRRNQGKENKGKKSGAEQSSPVAIAKYEMPYIQKET